MLALPRRPVTASLGVKNASLEGGSCKTRGAKVFFEDRPKSSRVDLVLEPFVEEKAHPQASFSICPSPGWLASDATSRLSRTWRLRPAHSRSPPGRDRLPHPKALLLDEMQCRLGVFGVLAQSEARKPRKERMAEIHLKSHFEICKVRAKGRPGPIPCASCSQQSPLTLDLGSAELSCGATQSRRMRTAWKSDRKPS